MAYHTRRLGRETTAVMPRREDSTDEVSFIDILFAIVLGIGIEAIVTEPWLKDYHGFARLAFWTFVLAGMVVIGSWLGYHIAMRELGRGITGRRQFFRFCIDICLLFEYARILKRFDDLNFVLLQIAVIYVWYLLWDLVSYGEWGGAHWVVSLVGSGLFFVLWALESQGSQPASQARGFAIVFASIVLTIGYRLVPAHWFSEGTSNNAAS
ncbi:MAG: hypothetical protein ACRD11_06785 [Terriglobia bacterium]